MFIPCTVTLIDGGRYRIALMKELRRIRLDLSLQQVQQLIDNLPQVIVRDVDMEIADRVARDLRSAGAEVRTDKPDLSTDIHAWLREKHTPEQVLAASLQAWQELEPNLEAGDELWRFSSPEIFWANLCGREGYAIVRNGRVIKATLTALN